jgi:NADH-quinone oxidoreductase subunit E
VKATNHYAEVKDVDPLVALNAHTREHIDQWAAKFPPERKRSALIQGLMAAQEQNSGWLTDELITAVAKYLGLPADLGLRSRQLLLDVRDAPGRTQQCRGLHQHLVLAEWRRRHTSPLRKKARREGRESTADGRVYLKPEEECSRPAAARR